MGKRYEHDPIVEALCEFRLAPETPWDPTIPGRFYEKVREAYPERQQRTLQEVEVASGPEGLQQRVRLAERLLLFSQDRKRLLQLGPRILVVNVLKPYPSWAGFRPCIELAWQRLCEIVDVQALEHVGLRYINRIELPRGLADMEAYLDLRLHLGDRLPQRVRSFVVGAEFTLDDGEIRCRVQLTPMLRDDDQHDVMLDIDCFAAEARAIAIAEVMTWIETAHARVEEIFEGCITDRLRARFEGRGNE